MNRKCQARFGALRLLLRCYADVALARVSPSSDRKRTAAITTAKVGFHRLVWFALAVLFAFNTPSALAQSIYYWRNDTGGTWWSDANKWWNGGGLTLANNTSYDAYLNFGGDGMNTSTNSLTGLGVRGIIFESGSSARTLDGNELKIGYNGTGKIENNSANTQTINLTLSNAYNSGLEFNAVTASLLLNSVYLGSSTTVNLYGSNNNVLNFRGLVSGSATMNWINSRDNKVVFSASNSMSGTLNVNRGYLIVSNASATLGSSTINIGEAGQTQFAEVQFGTGGTAQTNALSNNIVIKSESANNGANRSISSLNTSGTNTITGTLENNNSGLTAKLFITSGGTLRFSNVVSGAGAFYLDNGGGGTLELNAANTLSGGFYIDNGTIKLSGSSATAGSGILALGATGGGSGATVLYSGTGGGITLTNSSLDVRTGAGARQIVSENTSGTNKFTGTVNLANTLTISNASGGEFQVAGAITNTGGLTKTGAGTLTLSANNSFSGKVLISEGTISVTNANSLGSGVLQIGNGTTTTTLLVNSNTSHAGSFAITDSSTAGVISVAAGATFTQSGQLSQTNGTANTTKFGKSGAGTLILNGGGSAYSGQIQIGEGTVIIGANNSLSTNVTTANRGVDLGLNVGDTSMGNNVSLLLSNGVTLSNSIYVAPNTTSATRTIGMSGTGAASFTNEIYLDGTLDVTAESGANATISGNIVKNSGGAGGGLTKTGAGTVTLSGANTYVGTTYVNAGTLVAATNAASLGAGSLVLNGGNLSLLMTNSTSFNRNTTLSNNATITYDKVAGTTSGNATMGTLTMSGARTLTVTEGPNMVSDAVGLKFSSLTLSGGDATFSVATNTYLYFTGGVDGGGRNITTDLGSSPYFNSLRIDGSISNTVKITMGGTGGGRLYLGGSNSFSGGLDQQTGILEIGNAYALGTGTWTIGKLGGSAVTFHVQSTVSSNANNNAILINNNFTLGGDGGRATTYNIGTGAVTLGTNVSATINSNLVIGGVIGDGGNGYSFTKTGGGTLTLTAPNTYTGGTTISGGRLELKGSGALSAQGNVHLVNVATAIFDISGISGSGTTIGSLSGASSVATVALGGKTLTLVGDSYDKTNNATVTGTGGLIKTGTGTLVVDAASTYSGGTIISNGTVRIGNTYSGVAGNVTNAALGTGTITLKGGSLTAADANAKTNINAIAIGGNVALGESGKGGLTFLGNVDLGTGASTVTFESAATFAGSITNSGGFVKAGSSALTISGNNSFGGGLTLSAGTLNINSASALGTGTFTISGGTINNSSGGAISNMANNAMAWNGDFTFTGTSSLDLGTGSVALGSSRTVSISANNLSVGGIGGAAYSLTKTGSGTLTIVGASTYSGGTTITNGTLALVGNGSLLSTGAVNVGNNNNPRFDISGLSGSGTSIGSLDVGLNGKVELGSKNLTIAGNDVSTTVAGVVSGSGGGLTKSGTGTLILTSSNTYTGSTILTDGVLRVGRTFSGVVGNITNSSIGTGILDLRGGRMSAVDASQSTYYNNLAIGGNVSLGDTVIGTGGLVFQGNVDLGTGTRTVTTDQGVTMNGVISNSGGLIKAGSAGLTLTASNTFSGGLTLNAGTLNIGNAGALGTGTFTIGGGTIYNTTGAMLTNSQNNAMIWQGSFAFSGTNSLDLGTGAVTLAAASSADIANTRELIVRGAIGGSYGLTKAGLGTLILSGANTYTGDTTINSGAILMANSNALQNSTVDLAVANGVKFTNGLTEANFGMLKGAANLALTNFDGTAVALTVGGNNSSSIYSGGFNGGGSFTKVGSGTLTLAGTNAHAGANVVHQGTLAVTGKLNNGGGLTVSNTGTLSGSGSIGGTTTIIGGGTISPGNSPGTIYVTNMVFGTNGNYNWQLYDAAGTKGATDGYDWISGSGSLTISANATDKFNINLWTLSGIGPDTNGSAINFTNSSDYQWTLGTWNSISGFDASYFSLNTSAINGTGGFANAFTGTFTLTSSNKSIFLNYTAASGPPVYSGGSGVWSTGFSPALTQGATNAYFTGAGGTATNDIASATVNTIGNLTFSNGAGSYTLTASNGAAGYDAASALAITGNIVNNSASAQTINLALGFSNASTIDAAAGHMTFGGAISNGTSLTFAGASNNTVSGAISGAGALIKTGTGTLTLADNNSYGGATTISNGTLNIALLADAGSNSSIGTSATVTMAGSNATNTVINYTGGNVTTDRNFVFNGTAASGEGGTINMSSSNTAVTLDGSASGTGKMIIGEGTLVLANTGATNQFAPGAIQVDSGATLVLAAADQIGDSTGLILNGGTFLVGTDSARYSETLGSLTLSASSTIDLGSYSGGTSTLQFANSSAITWTGTLTITNWQGVAMTTNDVSRILFGTGGLTSTQLGQIYFASQDINGGALIGGELVPVPEPRVYAAAIALLAAVGWRERKRMRALLGLRKKVASASCR